jgi:hypothetical protein
MMKNKNLENLEQADSENFSGENISDYNVHNREHDFIES